MSDVVLLVDSALTERALVTGRLPPEGRDVDVLVRCASDADAVVRVLRAAGFVAVGDRWARFADCGADVVDIAVAESWHLPADELDELFETSTPVDATAHLRLPSPATTVLLEARRWQQGGMLTPGRRRRVDDALASPGVEAELRRRAQRWQLDSVLPVLRGERPRQVTARRVARRIRRPSGVVVSFSGVDGSGKSSQVEALRSTLEVLGYDVVTVWTRITINPSIERVGLPLKRLVRAALRATSSSRSSTETVPEERVDPARELRQRSRLLSEPWITFVAVVNAAAVRRATTAHLVRGAVVLCDRYALDSAAHLRYKYGAHQRYRFQARLIQWLTPRPLRSFFLDVPGASAFRRKPEKYTPEQLEHLASLYRDEHGWLGVRRLDGERDRAELCATIASEVATALADRRQRRGSTRRRRR